MNEETKSTVLEGSAFARVLVRLMEAHLPRPVDEEKVLNLADWAGYDVEVFRARLAGDTEADFGDLSQLAYELGLSGDERQMLAMAYTYEREDLDGPEPTLEEMRDHLTVKVGMSAEEAEWILADGDLFLTDPDSRYGYASQEAMKVWGEAQEKLLHLWEAATRGNVFGNDGVGMLLQDAWLRAGELRKRAEERAGGEYWKCSLSVGPKTFWSTKIGYL
jgi:hypothetical protein